MKRAALYARFSSELQSDRSIDDQLALCRAFCAREGLAIASEHSDRAMSGASLQGRNGLESLLREVGAKRCDVVVVEALDRLSRDMGDLSNIWKQLQFAGVQLLAVHDGKADQVQIGVRGLVGALYLTDLANKTRRGLAGKLRAGMRAGGLPFGYRPVTGKPGEHEIFEPEATIVSRIFREYASGKSPRAIAGSLNADGIRPYRGRAWNASTLNGSAKRASGLLSNEVYRGEIVWNKVGKVKNPATGKRVPRINPPSEWQRVSAPHLRIVDEDLWLAVQSMRQRRQHAGAAKVRTPKRLLSGLLKCSECGSGIVSAGSDHGRPVAQCSRVRESGDCSNKRRVYLDAIEVAVLEGLTEQLAHPEVIAEALREYHAEMRRLDGSRARNRSENERKLGEAERKIARLVDAIADGVGDGRAVALKIGELERETDALRSELARSPQADVVALHPNALNRYIAAIEDLSQNLASGRNSEAMAIVRDLVDSITVYPRNAGEPVRFEVRGRLVALLDPSVGTVVPRGWHNQDHREPNPLFTFQKHA